MNENWKIVDRAPRAHADRPKHQGRRRDGADVTCACAAFALASAVLVGMTAPAFATEDPEENRIWHGCELTADAVTDIRNSIDTSDDGSPPDVLVNDTELEIAFVIVYSLNNDNDGQELNSGSDDFTGPIICTGPGFDAAPTEQTTQIPNVTIRDAEDAFFLRYELSGGGFEKRVCHSVNSNTDCVRVHPSP